jgi:hypothetical protein
MPTYHMRSGFPSTNNKSTLFTSKVSPKELEYEVRDRFALNKYQPDQVRVLACIGKLLSPYENIRPCLLVRQDQQKGSVLNTIRWLRPIKDYTYIAPLTPVKISNCL